MESGFQTLKNALLKGIENSSRIMQDGSAPSGAALLGIDTCVNTDSCAYITGYPGSATLTGSTDQLSAAYTAQLQAQAQVALQAQQLSTATLNTAANAATQATWPTPTGWIYYKNGSGVEVSEISEVSELKFEGKVAFDLVVSLCRNKKYLEDCTIQYNSEVHTVYLKHEEFERPMQIKLKRQVTIDDIEGELRFLQDEIEKGITKDEDQL